MLGSCARYPISPRGRAFDLGQSRRTRLRQSCDANRMQRVADERGNYAKARRPADRRALALWERGLSLVAAEENLQRRSNGRHAGERYLRRYVLPRRHGGNDLRYGRRDGEKMKIDGLARTVGMQAMCETK